MARARKYKTHADARPIPETLPEGLVLLDLDEAPDSLGRQLFSAFWAQDIRWRIPKDSPLSGLVAGQCFFTRAEDFTARWLELHPDGAVACRLPAPAYAVPDLVALFDDPLLASPATPDR